MSAMNLITLSDCKKALAPRNLDAHKGLFGHVLVIGGDNGMGGAVHLAGEAALRTGAGLVSVITRPEYAYAMTSTCPELMCYGVEEEGCLEKTLMPLLKRATIVVLGPGLGQSVWGESLFQILLKHYAEPMVLDGDGLNLLVKYKQKRDNWILTPHPGEASRLLTGVIADASISYIQTHRLEVLQSLQKTYGGTVVLKGADTIIIGKSNIPVQYEGSNPAMATAGMGDVLSGIIGGLVAQNLDVETAAQLGVCVQGAAGKLAAAQHERGVLASDLLKMIPECLN
jgi:NAD(P)H-hydrate epimerase